MNGIAVTVCTDRRSKDLWLTFDDAGTCDDLAAAIRSGMGDSTLSLRVRRSGAAIAGPSSALDLDLLHGDVVEAGAVERRRAPVRLVRTGRVGPETISLAGAAKVGRTGAGSDIALNDPTVSRHHAVLEVDASGVRVSDVGSMNGTKVNGERIKSMRILQNLDVVEFGDNSQFRVEIEQAALRYATPAALGAHMQRSAGRVYVSRSWREMRQRPATAVEIGAAPDRPVSRRFPIPMVVLPAIAAIAIVALTGNVMFLAFSALGPMMALWNWWDDRRSGIGQYRSAKDAYLSSLAAADAAATAAREELRSWWEWNLPPSGEILNRALTLDTRLWDRLRSHPDFLEIRVGRGAVPVERRVDLKERGDGDLVRQAVAIRDEHQMDRDMPVPLRLNDVGVLTVVGPLDQSLSFARSVALQLAVRNSPNEVRIGFVGGDWSWASWLPHTSRGNEAPLVAGSDEVSATRLLLEVDSRISAAQRGEEPLDHLLLIVRPPISLPAARLNSILAMARTAKISVLWIADASGPPPESAAVLTIGPNSTLQMGSSKAIALSQVEAVDEPTSADVARVLAPLVDPGSSTDTSIPNRVGLLDLLGSDVTDPDALVRRWQKPYEEGLRAAIGLGKNGRVEIDLSAAGDGPNGLVGGTVGAGKSEFLQSLVLSLATSYGPDRLNFLFVDFKGGATFAPLLDLPHVVGMIRNLDGDLALRAQASLQAEFLRRQALLPAAGVAKMSELWTVDPSRALPALVVVIDEYAELAQKRPEFLETVVELAQTGRALGLHLLLATQAPGHSVSRTIQNCAKYRVSFRLKDKSESAEVLGHGADASKLPNRPGRGFFLDGDNELHEFQAAWAGGRSQVDGSAHVEAMTMYRKPSGQSTGGPSDLERVADSIIAASTRGRFAAPRRPWHEPLPQAVPFNHLNAPAVSSGANELPLGMIDLPSQQLQRSYSWNFADSANLLVYGENDCGKTTLLRTLAASSARLRGPGGVEVVGIDAGGGGLSTIDALPNVRGVVSSIDTAAMRRAIAHLRREQEVRLRLIERSGSLRAHRQATGDDIPDLLVLIDGLSQLMSMLEVVDSGTLLNTLMQMITDSAPAGIHFAITTDQPQRVPMSIKNPARERLVFRLTNRDATSATDIGRSTAHLVNGRAVSVQHNGEAQIAVLGALDALGKSPGPAEQKQALDEIAESLRPTSRELAARLPQPRRSLRAVDLPPAPDRTRIPIGLDDLFLEPITLDLGATPTLAIAGPDLTGRTTAIQLVERMVRQADDRLVSIYLNGRAERPAVVDGWTHQLTEVNAALDVIEAVAATVVERGMLEHPVLIAIDDADDLIANPIGLPPEETQQRKRLSVAMESLLKAGRSAGVVLVIAGRFTQLGSAVPWAQRFRQNGQAVLLCPATLDVTVTDPVFNASLPRRTGYRPEPGTAVVLRRGDTPRLVQLADVGRNGHS